MYGNEATPWELFNHEVDENNQLVLPWVTNVDPLGKIEADVRVLYVFTKLSNVGKTEKSSDKMENRVAGCGTWHGNKTKEAVCGSEGTVIGYKRSFTFRSARNQTTVGQWNMVEYNMEGAEDFVLCKIKRNDSNASIGGRIVSTSASSATSMVGEASTYLSAKKKSKTDKFTKNSSSTSEDHGISKVVAAQEPSWAASGVDNTMNNSVFSSWGDQFQQQQQYLQPVLMMPAGVVHNQEPLREKQWINYMNLNKNNYLQQLGRIVSEGDRMPPLVDAEENVFNQKEFLDIGDDFFDVEGIIKELIQRRLMMMWQTKIQNIITCSMIPPRPCPTTSCFNNHYPPHPPTTTSKTH
ncbi:OLC1v1016145C1 [Oldenlandia corymbosa var. corymbosa]|uniref:OLC1v1016145C1 n=1 Tax=Oldenlandia corymbosa var. corymbosa TaxID=529605 RepID=A0AAV1E543_OLDCO|nr:OLC1v1016145C1 [Oldenlandia corymbosa var. corymbosa]